MPSLQQEVSDGGRAEALLKNETFQKAFSEVRQAIIAAWEKAPIRDTEGQQQLKLMLKLLKDLEANIKTVVQTGQLASLQISQGAEKESRMMKFMRGIGNA